MIATSRYGRAPTTSWLVVPARAYLSKEYFFEHYLPTRDPDDDVRLSVDHKGLRPTMSRRYLEVTEVSAALQRGSAVQCFLGACSRDGKPGVRWLSLEGTNRISVYIYETADLGSEARCDLYEFGPLNSSLAFGDSDEELNFADLKGCLRLLGSRFPGSIARLVNEGAIQDEYADFIAKGRK